MNGISHKQAIKWIHRRLDGLLTERQLLILEEHLHSCDSCHAYASEIDLLPTVLQSEFHARWDAKPGPPPKVFEHMEAKARRIPMTNRISSGIKLFAGVAALVMLGFFVNLVVSQLRTTSITATGSEVVNVPPRAEDRLLAFTSDQNGNFDIYTIRADGSGLTNLTNSPAQDVSPAWSPDGKRIAFESDRNGFRQIFLMDADGSNLVQLKENEEEADQWIGEPYNLSLNLWSPDGNKLIFYEVALGDEKGMLYLIDANGENKKPLVNETGKYYSPSWSPDGKHIAFIAIENSVARIYSTDANGDHLTNVTKALPSNETLYPMKYSWSRNGQSIEFIASNWNYLLGRGDDGTSAYKWTAYEASLDGNTLVANASADSQMGGYWAGTYFLSGSAAVASSPEFRWVHSDGTSTTANPIENCQKLLDSNTGNYLTGYSSYKQSSNGNVVIGAYCPNGDKWLFWANSEGIFIPLLNSPIHVQSIPSNAMRLWAPPDFIWSSDDKYIAFNIFSSGKTDMYIVNVNDALQNPSIQPFHLAIGLNYSLYYSPVWQPTP